VVSIIIVIVVYRSIKIVLKISDSTAYRRELTLLSFDMCQVPSRHHVEVKVFASRLLNVYNPILPVLVEGCVGGI